MDIPEAWIGLQGHYLHQPGVPREFRASLAGIIGDLERAGIAGLVSRRSEFYSVGQLTKDVRTPDGAFESVDVGHRPLEKRFELLVAAQLQRAGALIRMRADTPDFDCRVGGFAFGVEATTRARAEVGSALHDYLEAALVAGPSVHVTLRRTGEPLYTKPPGRNRPSRGSADR